MKFKEYNYLKYKRTNFNISKAKVTYRDLCKFARCRIEYWDNTVYGEWHHIKPKSMNGSNAKCNLIKLTYPEHLFAHYLLAIIYPKSSMTFAFHQMITLRKSNSRMKNISIRNIDFSDFKLLEKLRVEFVNMDRSGAITYKYSDEELIVLKNKALEYLKNNNEQHYTIGDITKLLDLPSIYVFTSRILNPLILDGKLDKDIFNFGPSAKYDDIKIKKIQDEILELVGDYYNSKHIRFCHIKKMYGMSSEVLLHKIVQPLIDSGKLYKHAFHFGKSAKYDDEDIKDMAIRARQILRNRRTNLDKICNELHIKLDIFLDRIKPLIKNSKEYKRLIVAKERIYSIKINNTLLIDKTRNEIKDYFEKHDIEYVKLNESGKVRLAYSFANNLCKLYHGAIIKIKSVDKSKYNVVKQIIYKSIIINSKEYNNLIKENIRDIILSFNKDRLNLNGKYISTKHFLNTLSKYYRQFEQLNIVI